MSSRAADDVSFGRVAEHYDLLMSGVPYRNWVRYLERLFDRRDVTPRRILDVACGTGNVTELLAALGYRMTGVDLSAPMIEVAHQKAERRGLAIEYLVQDASDLLIDALPYDCVISLFDSLNYITRPASLAAAFQRMYSHLRPGGLIAFDMNSAYALENRFFDQDSLGANEPIQYIWRSEFDESTRLCVVDMRFTVRSASGASEIFRETHTQYAYTEDEVRIMLADAGFRRIESFHAYTFRPVTALSDRIFYVAERSMD